MRAKNRQTERVLLAQGMLGAQRTKATGRT